MESSITLRVSKIVGVDLGTSPRSLYCKLSLIREGKKTVSRRTHDMEAVLGKDRNYNAVLDQCWSLP